MYPKYPNRGYLKARVYTIPVYYFGTWTLRGRNEVKRCLDSIIELIRVEGRGFTSQGSAIGCKKYRSPIYPALEDSSLTQIGTPPNEG